MKPIRHALDRYATSRSLVALIVLLTFAMVSVHILDTPWSLVRLKHMTGGVSILDAQLHYSADGARNLLTALGAHGRTFYLWRVLAALDVLLPALFATVLTVAMAVGFRGLVGERSAWRFAQWLPLGAMLLDYAENGLIATLLLDFPVEHRIVAAAAGWMTTAKQLGYMACVIVCLAAVVVRLGRMVKSFIAHGPREELTT